MISEITVWKSGGGIPMDYLKNLPEDPRPLAGLIEYREHRVVSMSLTRTESLQMMLMSVADDEMVASECYPGDTLYYVLDGTMLFDREGRKSVLHAGDVVAVPGDVEHAIGGGSRFKILQITLTV